jgi:hypothetical protein
MQAEKIGKMALAPTDYRMRAKRYNFDYRLVVPDYKTFDNLRDIALDHLGGYTLINKGKIYGGNGHGFASEYDFQGDLDNSRHKLYFRNREDAESVLTLYAIKHGTFE